jgi:hypothetical protein
MKETNEIDLLELMAQQYAESMLLQIDNEIYQEFQEIIKK